MLTVQGFSRSDSTRDRPVTPFFERVRPWKCSTRDHGAYQEIPTNSPPKQSNNRRLALPLIAAGLVLYFLFTAPFLLRRLLPTRQYTCGDTIEEAKTRGCSYDPLTLTWLPWQCSREGAAGFATAEDGHAFHYYADRHKATEIHDLGSRLGTNIYWSTAGEHLAHCAFIIIRKATSQETGEPLDHLSASLHHTRHCALMLLEAARFSPHFDQINTVGNITLGSC